MSIQSFNKSTLGTCADLALDNFDLWVFPTVLLAAWLYYPYCQEGPNLCVWKALFHKPCIGCGLTRGVCFLVHGHLHDAVRFNALSVVVILSMAATFSKATCDLCRTALNRRDHNRCMKARDGPAGSDSKPRHQEA